MKYEKSKIEKQIKNQKYLDDVFSALANPIRRAIIELVSANKECNVNWLADEIKVRFKDIFLEINSSKENKILTEQKESSPTRAAISQHLHILIDAGLIEQNRKGRIRMCNLQPKPLSSAFNWLVRYRIFWEQLLDDIEERVKSNPNDIEE